MQPPIALDILTSSAGPHGLILAREAHRVGLERELRTEHERGSLLRIRRGVYMTSTQWQQMSREQRYLSRVRAHALVAEDPPVFSHFSAAAVWGLPSFNSWPTDVHVATTPAAGGRSRYGVTRHPHHGTVDAVERNGLRVTSVAATAVALARLLPFSEAVAVLDSALHTPRTGTPLTTRAQIDTELSRLGRAPGRASARRAAEFASELSGSPGESISRANMFLLGFMLPELQVPFFDDAGLIGYVDFFWPRVRLIGEFDGKGKYLREEFLNGRSTAEVVIDEKTREDRLRGCGPRVCRWGWQTALSLAAFGDFLSQRGVPRAR